MSGPAWKLVKFAAPVLLAAACSHPQQPAALAPQPAPDLAAAARRDSLAAAPRRDSIALAQRNDSLMRLAAARAHADSLRAEVENGGGLDAANGAALLLPPAEDSVLVARIHFGFNEANLTPEGRVTLDQKVTLLKRYQRLRVEIAGNADERGSDEYNLALGLRRAAAAKAYLVNYGVAGDRLSVISYGKERPLDAAHTEEAWAANRRDEFFAKGNQ